MSKKIDRAAHGPSWSEVILGALLSLLLGVALGAVLMILRPVIVAKEEIKEADRKPGAVYFIEGSRDTNKGKQGLAKRKAFSSGQSVSVIEDEINAITGPAPGAPGAPAAAKAGDPKAGDPKAAEKKGDAKKAPAPAAPAPAADELMSVGAINVRIAGGALSLGVPVNFNVLGIAQKVIVQINGSFEKKGDSFVYRADQIMLGSCPAQRLPFVGGYVREKILSAITVPEDIKASWAKLANVTIEDRTLKLTMP
jgi:hypothetical protein